MTAQEKPQEKPGTIVQREIEHLEDVLASYEHLNDRLKTAIGEAQ